MTILLYTSYRRPLPEERFREYLCRLPKHLTASILNYKKWEDRQNTLYGKLLLANGLEMLGYSQRLLGTIMYSKHNRPYLDAPIDFNVSHSGRGIAVLISTKHRVGIDLESVLPVDVTDFRTCWSPEEWQTIMQAEILYNTFYSLWTRKEAVVKADGGGLTIPLKKLNVLVDSVRLNNTQWNLQPIDLFTDYRSHIAFDGDLAMSDILTREEQFQ